MINELTLLRKSVVVGFSALTLASITIPAQAINLIKNGGFIPSSSIGSPLVLVHLYHQVSTILIPLLLSRIGLSKTKMLVEQVLTT